jgi:hypothetical protein
MGVSCSVDATHHGSTFLIHRSLETPSTFDVRMDWVRLRGADDGGVRAHSYVTLPRHHTIVQLCAHSCASLPRHHTIVQLCVHTVVHRCHDTTPLCNCVCTQLCNVATTPYHCAIVCARSCASLPRHHTIAQLCAHSRDMGTPYSDFEGTKKLVPSIKRGQHAFVKLCLQSYLVFVLNSVDKKL